MKVELDSINTIFGIKFWGIRVFDNEGKRIGNFNVYLADMKELGVAKTMSSGKKAVQWLNDEVGQKWLSERIDNPTYTSLGAFLKSTS